MGRPRTSPPGLADRHPGVIISRQIIEVQRGLETGRLQLVKEVDPELHEDEAVIQPAAMIRRWQEVAGVPGLVDHAPRDCLSAEDHRLHRDESTVVCQYAADLFESAT